jgi:hypothetical protein
MSEPDKRRMNHDVTEKQLTDATKAVRSALNDTRKRAYEGDFAAAFAAAERAQFAAFDLKMLFSPDLSALDPPPPGRHARGPASDPEYAEALRDLHDHHDG